MAVFNDDFSVTANPIGGFWTPGRNTSRAQLLTTGGNAFGTGTNNDGYAYILGAGDSKIRTVVFRDATLSDSEPNSYEIEHLHRVTDGVGFTSGYEVDMGYAGGGINIVLWFSATSFVVLTGLVTDANFFPDGAGGQIRDGHIIITEIPPTKDRINVYADVGSGPVLFFHYIFGADAVNDASPLLTGDPAIAGFTTLGSSNLLGFKDATITTLAGGPFARPGFPSWPARYGKPAPHREFA